MDPEPQIHLELGPLLGSGGFGEVYQARMRSRGGLQTVVAVKVTHPNVILLDDAVTRLRDEGLLLARIQHPVVVRALDLLQIQGRLALVTEYVPGADLTRFVQGPDPIPPRALVAVIGRVASALHAAWSAPGPDGAPLRIVHRDIKPSNIRIGRHGEVRLLDFGIARFQGSARESTTSGVLIGSMPYLAPERLTGCQTLPPADVFGLGCCLYEGLARRRLHPPGSLRQLLRLALDAERSRAHLDARLELLRAEPHDRALIALLRRCLEHDPAQRPTAAEVAERCEALTERMTGPSLRRWCAGIDWPRPSEIAGVMSGETLSTAEGPPPIPTASRSGGGEGTPLIHHRPLSTLDPGMFEAGDPPPMTRSRSTPKAPPAFPSIPLGVALEQLQISEAEVSEVLAPPPPRAPTPPEPPPQRPQPPTEPQPEDSAATQWLLVGLGCAAFVLVSLIVSSVIVAAGAVFFL